MEDGGGVARFADRAYPKDPWTFQSKGSNPLQQGLVPSKPFPCESPDS